ncbi:response regulator [Methylocystis echinoides]|uniref:response regulator n=1 Tax=Methylocystis echinoides TaxID=29468 RepID=UPI003D814E23
MRILVIDQPIIVSGISAMIGDELHVELIHASDILNGLAAFRLRKPEVTIAGMAVNGASGLELTRKILEIDPNARVILLGMSDDPIFLGRAMEVGAHAYLKKTDDPYLLFHALLEATVREAGSKSLPANADARCARLRDLRISAG